MPAALAAYAARPGGGDVQLPVEDESSRASVAWRDLTLFDFLAGHYKRGAKCSKPAIVGRKTVHPDKDPQEYYYALLLMHTPWRAHGDWLVEEDGGDHKVAFGRLVMQGTLVIKSVCFPRMPLSIEVA